MKIYVDQSKCIAAGNCVMLAPEVFDQRDEDGVVVLLDENPPEELYGKIRAAASACPANVIRLED